MGTHSKVQFAWRKLWAQISLLLCAAVLLGARAEGAVIDWSANYADDAVVANGATITNAGITTTIGISSFDDNDGGTPDLALYSGRAAFVTVEYNTQGNYTGGYLAAAFDNSNNDPADYVRITLTFSAPVTGLSFTILDVDSDSWDDGLEVIYNGSTNVRTTSGVYTIVNNVNPTVGLDDEAGYQGFEGTGANSGLTENRGNIAFNFGATAVTTIQFTYFSTDDANSNPGAQIIGFTDFTFVPEPSTYAMLGLLAGIGYRWRTKRKAA